MLLFSPNGVGNFNIIGALGAKNILSFSQLPESLMFCHFKTKQTNKLCAVYQSEAELNMSLIQKNINTIIGSNYGVNVFIGNKLDNHFVTGRSGQPYTPRTRLKYNNHS